MVECEVVGVLLDQSIPAPVLRLRERSGERRELDIHIGAPEAASIHAALEGVTMPRPLTHDLFVDVLGRLNAPIASMRIVELRESTYFAVLVLHRGDDIVEISCRPSDGVALALRSGSPILVSESVLAEAGRTAIGSSETEILEEFKDFIEGVRPEDFGS